MPKPTSWSDDPECNFVKIFLNEFLESGTITVDLELTSPKFIKVFFFIE